MELDSVRGLKADLKHKIFREISLSPEEAEAHGLPAGRIADFEEPIPMLSLGVTTAKPGDFKVAVRLQHPGLEGGPHVDHIDRTSKGEMNVRYIGRVVAHTDWHQTKQRPLLIGASAGHYETKGGTLGCFVTLKGGDGSPRILSNNHVLANENRGKKGDAVIQPNTFDGGTKGTDTIGRLDNFIELIRKGANTVDCALATVEPGIPTDPRTLTGVGPLAGLKADFAGVDLVQKIGRTTGLTEGRATAFELDDVVFEYEDIGTVRFDDQIEIEGAGAEAFSSPGDSGSLVFTTGTLLGFGLLVAGSETGGSNGKGLTFASLLDTVLNQLNAQLLT